MNQKQLIKEVMSQQGKLLVREATALVRSDIFQPAVQEMQQSFDDHPVTREIEDGYMADNISNTLVGVKSKDYPRNLFSFIGFEQGSDPTDSIRDLLSESNPLGPKMKYIRGSQIENITFEFRVTPPAKKDIFDASPMPWADGLSWADRIEKGIPGVTQFLAKPNLPQSRSEGGIQIEAQVSPGARFKNTSYMSRILNEFVQNINKADKNI